MKLNSVLQDLLSLDVLSQQFVFAKRRKEMLFVFKPLILMLMAWDSNLSILCFGCSCLCHFAEPPWPDFHFEIMMKMFSKNSDENDQNVNLTGTHILLSCPQHHLHALHVMLRNIAVWDLSKLFLGTTI